MIVVFGFCFGGRDTSQAAHKALLVVPADVVGGDVLDMKYTFPRKEVRIGRGTVQDFECPWPSKCVICVHGSQIRTSADNRSRLPSGA
jgi:hypothetical protein